MNSACLGVFLSSLTIFFVSMGLQVFTTPYSIGYSVLSDAQVSSLPMASLINKASYTVVPTAASVSYAVLDQGGNLDNNFNAVVSALDYFLAFTNECHNPNILPHILTLCSFPMEPPHMHGLSQASPTT